MATPTILLRNNPAYKASKLLGYNPYGTRFIPIEMDFARSSSGSVEKSTGIVNMGTGVPRVDVNGSVLLEPARTNLLTYSEQFDNAAWSKSGGGTGSAPVVTANASTAPDGTTTADQIDFDRGAGNTASDLSQIYQTYTAASGTTYQQTFYVKATTGADVGKEIGIRLAGTASFTIVTLTAEYQRVVHEETSSVTGARAYEIVSRGAITADNQVSIIIWGAQLEAGSYATTYIPTVASTVTRTAETLSKTGLASYLGDSEGTIYFEGSWLDLNSGSSRITLSDGTNNNRVVLYAPADNISAFIVVGGVSSGAFGGLSASDNQVYRIAIKYANNDYAIWVDGVEIGTFNSGGVFADGTLTYLKFSGATGNSPFYGNIKALAVYDTALSDTELAILTTL